MSPSARHGRKNAPVAAPPGVFLRPLEQERAALQHDSEVLALQNARLVHENLLLHSEHLAAEAKLVLARQHMKLHMQSLTAGFSNTMQPQFQQSVQMNMAESSGAQRLKLGQMYPGAWQKHPGQDVYDTSLVLPVGGRSSIHSTGTERKSLSSQSTLSCADSVASYGLPSQTKAASKARHSSDLSTCFTHLSSTRTRANSSESSDSFESDSPKRINSFRTCASSFSDSPSRKNSFDTSGTVLSGQHDIKIQKILASKPTCARSVYCGRQEVECATTTAALLTTVMVRNLPNEYTRAMLLELIDSSGFAGSYDLVYLPMDFQKKVSLGYCFINFTDSEVAVHFRDHFASVCEWSTYSNKVCEVAWSDSTQGIDANIQRYRNCPVMHESVPDECKPLLFEDGVRIPFPAPTKWIRAPRQWLRRH